MVQNAFKAQALLTLGKGVGPRGMSWPAHKGHEGIGNKEGLDENARRMNFDEDAEALGEVMRNLVEYEARR